MHFRDLGQDFLVNAVIVFEGGIVSGLFSDHESDGEREIDQIRKVGDLERGGERQGARREGGRR